MLRLHFFPSALFQMEVVCQNADHLNHHIMTSLSLNYAVMEATVHAH